MTPFVPLLLALSTPTADHHGPRAPDAQFPSHVFQWAPHERPRVELAFHYGLAQPVFLHGFNAAVDVRWQRFVFTYSHGQGLDYTNVRGALSPAEQQAGETLLLRVSTGFGVGAVLFDECYLLADFKFHHFEPRLGADASSYDTITVGAELGYRFFIWKGLNVTPVVRFWPNVWTNAPAAGIPLTSGNTTVVHHAAQQGFGGTGLFANVLVGWAFDL